MSVHLNQSPGFPLATGQTSVITYQGARALEADKEQRLGNDAAILVACEALNGATRWAELNPFCGT